MATGNIKITIITDQDGKQKNTTVDKDGEQKQAVNYASKPNLGKSVLANQVFNEVKSIVVNEAKYEVGKYFDLHDDYVGERDLNIAMTIVSDVASIGKATLIGAQTGGLAGASVGFILASATQIVNVYQNLDKQSIKIKQLDTQLQYSRTRAGYSLTSESIGENR